MNPEGVCDGPQDVSKEMQGVYSERSASGFTMDPNQEYIDQNRLYKRRQEPDGFEQLWLAYPSTRRNRREEAAEIYRDAVTKGATIEAMLSALEEEKSSYDWAKENGRYVPGIVKWLQREAWRDYIQLDADGQTQEEELWTTE